MTHIAILLLTEIPCCWLLTVTKSVVPCLKVSKQKLATDRKREGWRWYEVLQRHWCSNEEQHTLQYGHKALKLMPGHFHKKVHSWAICINLFDNSTLLYDNHCMIYHIYPQTYQQIITNNLDMTVDGWETEKKCGPCWELNMSDIKVTPIMTTAVSEQDKTGFDNLYKKDQYFKEQIIQKLIY